MSRLMASALAVVVAAVMGFGAGWHAKGVSMTAGQVRESQQAMREITRSVAEQSEKQQADMREEQTKSVALAAELALVRAAGADIRLEIDHAAFRPTPLVAGACPDATGSDQFVRLYDRAAYGVSTPTTPTAGAGGVHESIAGNLRAGVEPPAVGIRGPERW